MVEIVDIRETKRFTSSDYFGSVEEINCIDTDVGWWREMVIYLITITMEEGNKGRMVGEESKNE